MKSEVNVGFGTALAVVGIVLVIAIAVSIFFGTIAINSLIGIFGLGIPALSFQEGFWALLCMWFLGFVVYPRPGRFFRKS